MTDSIALRTEKLSKHYRRGQPAVDKLNLSVQTGQVYGFLGQNGAGKTTTIRMLLDLARPTGGAAYLFDIDPRRDRSVLRRVGALVEGAAFYPYLSGRANLELLCGMARNPTKRVDALLEQVGLAADGNRRFSTYSTGMKQRLGIAAALLDDPDLIILDEPTNGLDPVGLVEIRDLIRSLVQQDGKTVFLSSHLLGEVEQICDRVAIIDQGRLVREGPIRDLLEGHGESVRIEVDHAQNALIALDRYWPATVVDDPTFCAIDVQAARGQIPQVVARLVDQQIAVFQVTPQRQSLEAVFMRLVKKPNDGATPS